MVHRKLNTLGGMTTYLRENLKGIFLNNFIVSELNFLPTCCIPRVHDIIIKLQERERGKISLQLLWCNVLVTSVKKTTAHTTLQLTPTINDYNAFIVINGLSISTNYNLRWWRELATLKVTSAANLFFAIK